MMGKIYHCQYVNEMASFLWNLIFWKPVDFFIAPFHADQGNVLLCIAKFNAKSHGLLPELFIFCTLLLISEPSEEMSTFGPFLM